MKEFEQQPAPVELVSWDAAQNVGKVAGSDWVCPTLDIHVLEGIHHLSGEITETDIAVFADGRRQHIELLKYPEGFHTAQIVDSSTGETLTDPQATQQYIGTLVCTCGSKHADASTISVLSMKSLPIGEDDSRILSDIENYNGKTACTIRSTVSIRDREHTQNRLHIRPGSHDLSVLTEGRTSLFEGTRARVDIEQYSGESVQTELMLWQPDQDSEDDDVKGQIGLRLDGNSRIQSLHVYKDGLLNLLGLDPSDVHAGATEWGYVTDPEQQKKVLDAIAAAAGWGNEWTGIDIKATAARLYAGMDDRNLDPLSAVIPNRQEQV